MKKKELMAYRKAARREGRQRPFLFPVGDVRITRSAAQAMNEADVLFSHFLVRHAQGDRGLANGVHGRVSIYSLASKKIVVTTDNGETLIAMEDEVQ
jgi:hypothetical protein